MVQYRRSRIPNAPYFLTATLRDRTSDALVRHAKWLRFAFREAAREHPFRIDAIAVLPDHFHVICSLPEDDYDFSTRMQSIKRHFVASLTCNGVGLRFNAQRECDLWQSRFWEHTIRDEADLERHVDYVHFNPVKHGLVAAVEDWPYSSFHRYVREGRLPIDWGGRVGRESVSLAGEPPDCERALPDFVRATTATTTTKGR
jgi:putative transposase